MKKTPTITTLTILERLVDLEDPYSTVASKREFRIFEELLRSDFIAGEAGPASHDDADTAVREIILTTEGRLLAERLKKEQKESSFWYVTWRWLGPTIGFFGGIAASIVTRLVERHFGL